MACPIAVTGIGLVTPGGIGTAATWKAVCGGCSTARTDPQLEGLPVDFSCRVPGFDADSVPGIRQPWRYDRSTQLLLAAAAEALRSAHLDPAEWDPSRVALVVGSAAGGISTLETQYRKFLDHGPRNLSPLTLTGYLPNMAAGHLTLVLGITGPALQTSTACASGASAVITACLLLDAGLCDIALAAGCDVMTTPFCAAAFAKMGALSRRTHDPERASRPFDRHRDGFVLGEGSAVIVLERTPHATARQVCPRAHVVGHATTSDAHHATTPHPEGRGLRSAVLQTLRAADAALGDVDHINAHGTSTLLNDRTEAAVIRTLFQSREPSITSAKGVLGHTMGAAGAIEAALTVMSLEQQAVPPVANFTEPDEAADGLDLVTGHARHQNLRLALSHSLGFGGHNTVLAFASVP
ncbi:beta-ketoacyl-[acyl-carrier-protein] synthase family protein [Streptomyces violascens]|uniref:3-oxoacyl-ACP synthase n=1 Tax=Streptomyces violascens TaxID=67381 RepID=A0ABQ3QSN5_9ACTN|nr:beta-ketoacyl-[acyl-carrier-protein] synthase family protein [Streptomyces violascens]GGU33218.1 3-oxoacyl-ACP synthase [Streptomyces violascens]GHI40249.1 3-oxoacyl-ACP synthase [Streptomyces violascens]